MNEAGKFPEVAMLADSWPGIFVLFLLFLYFFLGSLGYGRLAGKAWRKQGGVLETTSDAFLFASALLWLIAFLLASVHGLGLVPSWAWWLIFAPGVLASLPMLRELLKSARERHAYFLVLFAFIFLLRALTASLPARHGDPLLYHLLGPRLWMEAGGFTMHEQLPNALLASTWEVLYLWPQLFWYSAKPLFGLVEAQLFSQWLHLFLAWAGGAVLVMRLFRGFLRPILLPFAGLAALFVSGLHWTAPLAKNDVGIAFWALGAVVYFMEALQRRSCTRALLAGFFAGLAISGKITALLTLGPLLLACLVTAKAWRSWRITIPVISAGALGFIGGALPLYARNYLLSGNPFFPMFPALFPSPFLAPSYEAHFAQVQPSSPLHSLPLIWQRAPDLWRESPFIVGAILLLVIGLFSRRRTWQGMEDFSVEILIVGCLFAYSLFAVTQSALIELRYLGASLQIFAGGGVVLLLRGINRIPSARLRHSAVALLLVAILASSKLPLHVAGKIWKEPLGVDYVRTHSAGEAKEWVRKNVGSHFTVLTGDNESYYLTPVAHAVLTERADLDRATQGEKDFGQFIKSVCERTRAKFLLDARPESGVGARFGAAVPQVAKVFSAQGANIYDLGKLEELVSPGTHSCPR